MGNISRPEAINDTCRTKDGEFTVFKFLLIFHHCLLEVPLPPNCNMHAKHTK